MAKQTLKTIISNDRSSFITLSLEPWSEDYGMNPGDEFEIIGKDADETCSFNIRYDEDVIYVYAEGEADYYPQIYQNGQPIYCGHNRSEEEAVENPIKRIMRCFAKLLNFNEG